MANRAYLYSKDKNLPKLRDLSESTYPFPLTYKILLGCDTKMVDSKIWNYDHPIAISGSFNEGLNKLYLFLDYLKTQSGIDIEKIETFKNETETFFTNHPDRKLDLFFLEGGEIFDLSGDIDPLEDQNEWLFSEINSISKEINEILKSQPTDVFSVYNSTWLQDLKKDIDLLEPYWSHVTYFSFNKS